MKVGIAVQHLGNAPLCYMGIIRVCEPCSVTMYLRSAC